MLKKNGVHSLNINKNLTPTKLGELFEIEHFKGSFFKVPKGSKPGSISVIHASL